MLVLSTQNFDSGLLSKFSKNNVEGPCITEGKKEAVVRICRVWLSCFTVPY